MQFLRALVCNFVDNTTTLEVTEHFSCFLPNKSTAVLKRYGRTLKMFNKT